VRWPQIRWARDRDTSDEGMLTCAVVQGLQGHGSFCLWMCSYSFRCKGRTELRVLQNTFSKKILVFIREKLRGGWIGFDIVWGIKFLEVTRSKSHVQGMRFSYGDCSEAVIILILGNVIYFQLV
jgi:hypothetical protein